MGFVTVARQFIGGRARTVSDGLKGKNFVGERQICALRLIGHNFPNTLTVPKEVRRG